LLDATPSPFALEICIRAGPAHNPSVMCRSCCRLGLFVLFDNARSRLGKGGNPIVRKPAWPSSAAIIISGVDVSRWPALVTPDKLKLMRPKLQKAVGILSVAVSEMTTLLGLHEMLATLTDTKFIGHMHHTSAYPGLIGTVSSIMSNMCIKLNALFDGTEQTSVDIRQAINLISAPPEREIILQFHGQTSVEARIDAERMINRLSYLRKRLRKHRVGKAFTNIANIRNNRIAHLDYIEGRNYIAVNVHDIRLCLINTGRIVDLLCRVLIQRAHNIPIMRELFRKDAKEFADSLHRGATINSASTAQG
jgi:hypothetical protein